MDYGALIEFIGFDIIFLGLLTLLASCVTGQLWKSTPAEAMGAFASGWRCYQKYLGGSLDSETKRSKRSLISMLLMAGLLGMVVNIAADRLLDTRTGLWSSEDELKCKAVNAVAENLVAAGRTKVYLGNHKTKERAKELLQHAYVSTLSSDNERLVAMLRYEYVAVKVLRVLFLETTLLFLVALFGPWRRRLGQGNFGKARFWRSAGQLCLLSALPILCLTLWSAQSKRYYKKIVHSYLVLAKDKDVIMSEKPASHPAPSGVSCGDLKLIPGLFYVAAAPGIQPSGSHHWHLSRSDQETTSARDRFCVSLPP